MQQRNSGKKRWQTNKRKPPKQTVTPSRQVVFEALVKWNQGSQDIQEIFEELLSENPLLDMDRRLAQNILYAVFRHRFQLDWIIDQLAAKGVSSLPANIQEILRIGLCQIFLLERIPPHAAVNEAVALVAQTPYSNLSGLVNALMRESLRRKEILEKGWEQVQEPWIRHSHPLWLYEWAVANLGNDRAAHWIAENQRIPRLWLRATITQILGTGWDGTYSYNQAAANRKLMERYHLNGTLDQEGLGILLPEQYSLTDLAMILDQGFASVQDRAAMEAVRLLDVQPGETVYDFCAAPGGKTLQIADALKGQGTLLAMDSSPRRMTRLRHNLDRCGFESIQTRQYKLGFEDPLPKCDAALLDVPCSGLGTLRKRIDLRYRLTLADVPDLAEKGFRLLSAASEMIKPGGRMVYSTCTLTEDENQQVVKRFISQKEPEWKMVTERIYPEWLSPGGTATGETDRESDGAYAALLVRR